MVGLDDSHDFLSGCSHVKRRGHRVSLLHTAFLSLVMAELNSINHANVCISQETILLAMNDLTLGKISTSTSRVDSGKYVGILMMCTIVALLLAIILVLILLLLMITEHFSVYFWHVSSETIAHVLKRFVLLLVYLVGREGVCTVLVYHAKFRFNGAIIDSLRYIIHLITLHCTFES